MAVTHDFENVRSFEIEKGRYFTQNESSAGKPVAILGYEVAKELFDNVQPVGKEITINKYKAQVIGVFKKEGWYRLISAASSSTSATHSSTLT
jgi:putative ABC transport system permease protein